MTRISVRGFVSKLVIDGVKTPEEPKSKIEGRGQAVTPREWERGRRFEWCRSLIEMAANMTGPPVLPVLLMNRVHVVHGFN